MRITALSTLFLVGLVACGNDQPADRDQAAAPADEPQAAAAGLTTPDWFEVDHDARTVTMDVVAGAAPEWNFNGFSSGSGQIVVPEGYEVTINFTNEDETGMAHSIGVDERTSNFPANFSQPTPVFEGAISENPTSLTESTLQGESETITFTADAAGDYSLVCYVPGHALVGMWVPFRVSAEGDAGVGS